MSLKIGDITTLSIYTYKLSYFVREGGGTHTQQKHSIRQRYFCIDLLCP